MTNDLDTHNRPPRKSMRDAAIDVVQILQRAGHVAYWAGGCVRDMLLAREPHDYDVATSALPEQVTTLFRKTRQVGAQFGVILVRIGGHQIEVATFRTDGDYSDGRRPDRVTFGTPEDDAQRRDFTINGMFYDPVAENVHDFVNGRDDLDKKVIRAIGVASDRFAEDHLRVLRAVKFAARFGFAIEPSTWKAMETSAPDLRRISPERIRMELEAILSRPGRALGVEMLAGCSAVDYLWPGSSELRHDMPRIVRILKALPDDAPVAPSLAAMLIASSPADTGKACRALRASNELTDRVRRLVARHREFDDPSALTLGNLKLLMACDGFGQLVDLAGAIHVADGKPASLTASIRERAAAIPADQVAPAPLVTGDDLAKLRIPAGPIYKRILDRVYYEQLNGELTSADGALRRAGELSDMG